MMDLHKGQLISLDRLNFIFFRSLRVNVGNGLYFIPHSEWCLSFTACLTLVFLQKKVG